METLEKIIEKVRPALQMDGGDMELIDYNEKEGVVKISLKGACSHCAISDITLTHLIEQEIKSAMPEVKKIEVV